MILRRGLCGFCDKGLGVDEEMPLVAEGVGGFICLNCARDAVRTFARHYTEPRRETAMDRARVQMMRAPLALRPAAEIPTDPAPEICGPTTPKGTDQC